MRQKIAIFIQEMVVFCATEPPGHSRVMGCITTAMRSLKALCPAVCLTSPPGRTRCYARKRSRPRGREARAISPTRLSKSHTLDSSGAIGARASSNAERDISCDGLHRRFKVGNPFDDGRVAIDLGDHPDARGMQSTLPGARQFADDDFLVLSLASGRSTIGHPKPTRGETHDEHHPIHDHSRRRTHYITDRQRSRRASGSYIRSASRLHGPGVSSARGSRSSG